MRWKEARDAKSEILERFSGRTGPPTSLYLGIAPTAVSKDYRVAVRVPELNELTNRLVEQIGKLASEEIDVRVSGRIIHELPQTENVHRRTLTIGSSVAHYRHTAGTLGFFAERLSDDAFGLVSCNHILTAEDTGRDGDEILSPGPADGGRRSQDVVGYLDGSYPRLKGGSSVDCAFAKVPRRLVQDPLALGSDDHLSPQVADIDAGLLVQKIGRTTHRTRGRVTAFDLDPIDVDYSFGVVRFANQIEISPVGTEPFSRPGDSGALIFTDDRRPFGLLYASTVKGFAYAHPVQAVLTSLGARIAE